MAKIFSSVDELIGGTPLLRLSRMEKALGLDAALIGKLEYLNPAGSVKDRVARAMLDAAERSGALCPQSVIIEATSGNTGIGICSVAAARGYRVIIVMPETMSEERKMLMRAYGAELVLSDGALGMAGSVALAEELARKYEHSFIPGQFVNPENVHAHFDTTGPEIWEDTDGKVEIFVAGVGTGGTITGVCEYLKSKDPSIQIVAVEPTSSPFLSKGVAGAHKIQGIGAGFIPEVLNTDIYDEIITVENDDAMRMGRMMGRTEGILVGISAGAALHAATVLAKKPQNKGKNIVVLLPDTGDRYLSTELFAEKDEI
jgi:cysteine synthase A